MSLFSESLLSQINAYVDGHYETSKNLYKQRNQNISKLKENLFKAKLCEWYCYKHLRSCGYSATYPDHSIYSSKEKSYDADLYCMTKNVFIHVKSITRESAEKYSLSWIVESNDPIVNKPQVNHWFALTEYISINEIRLIGWLNSLSAIYKPTKLNHPTKSCIYYQDIKHLL